jgi:hypothetical protein
MRGRLRFQPIAIAIAAWLGISVIFGLVQGTAEVGSNKPLLFLLFSNGVHFAVWALTLPLLARLVKRFPLQRGAVLRHGLVLLPCCFIIAFGVSVAYLTLVYSSWFPLSDHFPTYSSVLQRGVGLFLQMDLLACVFIVASLHAWRWLRAYQSEQVRSSELEKRLASAQLNALRMQLQPHFLFNTLHSIAGLVSENPGAARKMIVALGDFLRLTLEDNAVAMCTLDEELEFIRLYAAIEKMRLGDRMAIEYEIQNGAGEAMLPYLVLQPLVENAIRHGVARVGRPAGIWLRAVHQNEELHLTLENDGPRHDRDFRPGVGITNTLQRLRLHYGKNFQLNHESRPQGGCLVTLTVPYRTSHKDQSAYVSGGEPDLARSHR